MARTRIAYIDGLRGLAMLLVVYNHIELFIFNTISTLSVVLSTLHLPLFFFVSGLAMRSSRNFFNSSQSLLTKLKYIMIPTLIMGSLYALTFGLDYFSLFVTQYKLGYWFTFALSGMITANYLLVKLHSRFRLSLKQFDLLYICTILTSIMLLMAIYRLFGLGSTELNKVIDFFSLGMICRYFVFFGLGILFASNSEAIDSKLKHRAVQLLLIAIYGVLFLLPRQLSNLLRFTFFIQCITGVAAIYAVFKFGGVFNSGNILCKALVTTGRYTLPIYLFHYFLIQPAHQIVTILHIDVAMMGTPIVCTVSFILILLIVMASIGVAKAFTHIPWLYRLLFGKIPYSQIDHT